MTEPTLLGIPASEAVGHGNGACWIDTNGFRWLLNASFQFDGRTLFHHTGIPNSKVFDVHGVGDGSNVVQLIYCETAPNPMSRAPICGGLIRWIFEIERYPELVVRWDKESCFWINERGDLLDEDEFNMIGWLSCHGQSYDPEKMGDDLDEGTEESATCNRVVGNHASRGGIHSSL